MSSYARPTELHFTLAHLSSRSKLFYKQNSFTNMHTSSEQNQMGRTILTVSGIRHELNMRPWVSLLDALGDRLNLSGTNKGCEHGQCGACTVICDDKRILSCLSLTVMKDGSTITTIEGISSGDELHPCKPRLWSMMLSSAVIVPLARSAAQW